MHPSLTQIKDYRRSGEPQEIAEHLDSCERCQSVLEGLENLDSIASGMDLNPEELVSQSRKQVRTKIEGSKTRRFYTFIRYAASIVIIAGISWIFLNRTGEDVGLLEQEITSVYKAPPVLRNSTIEIWSNFSTLYQNSNFEEAFQLLESLDRKTGQLEFYKGLCKIYQPNPDYELAISFLSDSSVSRSRYAQQATYVTALCYLKMEDLENAKRILSQIQLTPTHYKIKESAELLETLP